MNPGRRRATGSRSGRAHHFHFRAGDEPHVPDAPPQLAAGLHMGDAGFLPLLHPAQGNKPGFQHLLGDGTAFAAARTGFGAIMPSALSMAKSKHIVPNFNFIVTSGVAAPLGKHIPGPDGPVATGAAAVAYRTFHDIDPAAYKPRRNDDRHGEQGFPRKNASSDENRFRVHTHSLMIPIGSALSIDF